MSVPRQTLVDRLERELREQKLFVRIHAAEVLCEHGFGFKVASQIEAEAATTLSGYRLGVWRVLARIAANDAERRRWVARIRAVMLDASAPDRIGAAESLAKLSVDDRADRAPLAEWLKSADDLAAPFALWLLLQSSDASERPTDEARLARLLESPEPIARLRAAFALGRTAAPSAPVIAQIHRRAEIEPRDSPAHVYLLGAACLHGPRGTATTRAFVDGLLHYLEKGKANEQFEAASVLGLTGASHARGALEAAFKSEEADARIGAAGALLRLTP